MDKRNGRSCVYCHCQYQRYANNLGLKCHLGTYLQIIKTETVTYVYFIKLVQESEHYIYETHLKSILWEDG